jgi:hypothetical protein
VRESCQLTVRSIAEEQANIDQETVRKILTEDIDMRKVCAKMVPKDQSMREFLTGEQITVLEHPNYSPDLAPSDFFLFPKIKEY